MGTMIFLLPADLSPDAAYELERAWVAGRDRIPWPTQIRVDLNRLIVQRLVSESGHLVVPWSIDGAGRLMSTSATLMERSFPYQLLLELARGKLNQVRGQAAQWQENGMRLSSAVQAHIRSANEAMSQAVAVTSSEECQGAAHLALTMSYRAADQLVHGYIDEFLPVRRQRQPDLQTKLGCRMSTALTDNSASALTATFGRISIAFPWSSIEPNEGRYNWEQQDALLDWARKEGLEVTGGPLIDFSSAQLPDWLWLWERDLTSLGKFMANYVTAVLERYGSSIRRWQLTTAGNSAKVLSLSEYELLWLTVRIARAARQVDRELEFTIGVAQPWCDYMASEKCDQSAYVFAETLVRELNLVALDVEIIMGVMPRGSYCRDLLETSCLLDSYAELGVPLRVTLGYPSGSTTDAKADPELCVDAGHWQTGVHEAVQADWAAAFAMLALSKPYVEAVHWVHFSDTDVHQFAHCGLLDAASRPKPSLEALGRLRQTHLC